MIYLRTFFGHDINYDQAVRFFTIHHLIYVLVAFLAIFGTLRVAERIKSYYRENKIKVYIAFLLVSLEILYHVHNWTYPRFSLPLHICSFATIMNITLLLTNNKRIWNYAFFFGVLGGIMALSMPFSLGYTYLNFRYYHFMIMHFLIIAVPIYYYKAYNYRVTYKNLLDVYRTVLLLAVPIYLVNKVLDTNYWYFTKIPPEMKDIFHNWPVYMTTFVAFLFASMNMLYYLSHKRFEHIKETEKVI